MEGVTFSVSAVEKREVKQSTMPYEDFLTTTIPHLKKPYFPIGQLPPAPLVLKATEEPGYVQTGFMNGFVGAAFAAYSIHHHLIISPDDVWIAITTAFSKYINAHAEEMREFFVSHDGQQELKIKDVGTIHTVNWNKLISQMSDKIKMNTKNDIQQWIEPDFSTTTELIHTVGSVVLMGAMAKYFSYKFELCCGLPGVTMRGTLEDWQNIRQRANKLLEFQQEELTKWHQVLTPILDEFIESFSGKVNKDFWNRIAHQIGGGSGPRHLSGWILAFVPFDDQNRYHLFDQTSIQKDNCYGKLNMNDVPTSAVSVPVIIDDNGVEYKTTFYAGHLYATVGSTPDSIRPSLGWLMLHNQE